MTGLHNAKKTTHSNFDEFAAKVRAMNTVDKQTFDLICLFAARRFACVRDGRSRAAYPV